MAFRKLEKLKINVSNETGEKYEYNGDAYFDIDDNQFKVSVPNDLISIIKTLDISSENISLKSPKGEKEKYYYLIADDLKLIKDIIYKSIHLKLKCEIQVDLVIVYQFETNSKYFKDTKGKIHFINESNSEDEWIRNRISQKHHTTELY